MLVAVLAAGAAALGAAAARSSRSSAPGKAASSRTVPIACPSPGLDGRLLAQVYLPSG